MRYVAQRRVWVRVHRARARLRRDVETDRHICYGWRIFTQPRGDARRARGDARAARSRRALDCFLRGFMEIKAHGAKAFGENFRRAFAAFAAFEQRGD